jgi:hypothetical protein
MRLQGSDWLQGDGVNMHISYSGEGRLHLGNKYVWVSMHHYCGPEFYLDRNMTKNYVFADDCEKDPIWPVFNEWNKKYMAMAKKAGKYWAMDTEE